MKTIITESKSAEKSLDKAPKEVQKSYEIWARLVESDGYEILKKFNGYNDENLKGDWIGYRSSRLNKQWRVIYFVDKKHQMHVIHVEKVTPHDYRRKK